MAYCTRTEVKAALGITDTADDTLIDAAILAAEEQLNGHCQRDGASSNFNIAASATKVFRPQDECTVWIDDLANVTSLVVKVGDNNGSYPTTLTIGTDFQVWPYNATSRQPVWPFTKLEAVNYSFPTWYSQPAIQVTGNFGWAAVPDAVNKACILLAIDQYKLNNAPFGVVGNNDFGTVRAGAGINRQAAALLAPFVRASE